ncbi:MAG: hypothetical protein U9M92_00400 [Patescibacteria group bacterium]|nr:hypothetical protein [Patescibacteria group bacterium]
MVRNRRELLKSSRLAKRRRLQTRLLILVILALIILVALVWFLRLERWHLQGITVEGERVTSEAQIKRVADEVLTGNYWRLISRRQRWFYPAEQLEQTLLDRFARLTTAEVYSRQGALMISVKERQPVAMWCPADDGQCYFIDRQAVVFSPAPHFSRRPYLTIQSTGVWPQAGQPAPIAADELARLLDLRSRLAKSLKQNGFQVSAINLVIISPDHQDYTFGIEIGAETFDLLVNLHQDSTDLLATLGTVLRSDSWLADFSDKNLSLEYLDLRFAPKVFYRFR